MQYMALIYDTEQNRNSITPEEQKQLMASLDFEAPNGESWRKLAARAWAFFGSLEEGNHLVFGHGGMPCALEIAY